MPDTQDYKQEFYKKCTKRYTESNIKKVRELRLWIKKTDPEIIMKIINQYLDLLRKNHISFERVYLYGTYAKGDPHEDSNIDLAIIAEKWHPDIFDAQFELMKIGRKVDTRIELHPFRKYDFDITNPYIREIITTGKLSLA